MAEPESNIGTKIVATAMDTAANAVDQTGMTGAAISACSTWLKNRIAQASQRRADEFCREIERTLACDGIDAGILSRMDNEHASALLCLYYKAVQAPDASVTPILARLAGRQLSGRIPTSVDLVDVGSFFERISAHQIEPLKEMLGAASYTLSTSRDFSGVCLSSDSNLSCWFV